MMVWGFLTIFVGAVLLSAVSDTTHDATTVSTRSHEQVTFSPENASTAVVAQTDHSHALTFFGNGTNSTLDAGTTIGTHVNLSTNGTIRKSTLKFPGDGPYNASYSFHGENFVTDGTSRVFINLIPLFFALSVMMAGVMMVFVAIRDFMKA